ncbi:MAG: Uncharacterized protein K0S27_478 [Gammaproteobacteria bacterium]|jgi:glutamine amidotransferase-like uncharacterized protein|nr:Uncharacterized protein [Gammaproteobacteria bacterium]
MKFNIYHFFNNKLSQFYSRASIVERKKLLIYFDKGVSWYSALGCLWRFKTLLNPSMVDVCLLSSKVIKTENWEHNTIALIIPGGRSKPYYTSLSEEGNKKIMNYVKKGGGYLGICAGAYYASKKTEFELHSPLELQLYGPLDLFQGKAKGPAYGSGKFSYTTLQGVEAARITWTPAESLSQGNEGYVYYNGGCYFSTDEDPRFTVLANYSDIQNHPAAVIEGHVGHGKVILTGTHFEVNPFMLRFYPFQGQRRNLINELILSKKYQDEVLTSILLRLKVPRSCFVSSQVRLDNSLNIQNSTHYRSKL